VVRAGLRGEDKPKRKLLPANLPRDEQRLSPGERKALAEHRDLIRPGAVLWFARQKPSKSIGLQPLFTRQINHMGTVVSIERNAAGEVVRYRMYHGRSKGKQARVTEHHYWQWPAMFTRGGKRYPPLGYWDQYLVGIAPIAST
jgi:hypothetical protein